MKPTYLLLIFFCAVCYVKNSDGARILGIFPLNIPSHFFMYQEILKGLVDRGHRIDVVSHYPLKRTHPNYINIINLTGKGIDVTNMTIDTFKNIGIENTDYAAATYGNKICNLLALPEFKKLIENPPNDPPYDLVITELFYANCYFAFGRHLKVPVVAVTAGSVPHYANEALGNPLNLAFVSEQKEGSIFYMNFWQRLRNTISTMWSGYLAQRVTESQNDIVKKHFGPKMPDIRALERDLSLLLCNSHHTLNGIRPSTPAVVEISGIHIAGDRSELSAELKKWLDNSTNGFIYVYFGSMLRFESFSKEILTEFYAGFAKIAPIRVLLKVSNLQELPPGLPKNVLAIKFVPQAQVFKHGNIRGFVTHGGIMGIHEAVTFKVPFIGIPIFSDQPLNVQNCVDRGIAVSLNSNDLTADKFVDAVNAIVHDPKYKNNMVTLSKQFLDRPRSPRDTAIFWIEYILKHGGDSLQSPAVKLSWWQLALLDVYGSLIISGLFTLYLFKLLLGAIIRRLFYRNITLPTAKKMV